MSYDPKLLEVVADAWDAWWACLPSELDPQIPVREQFAKRILTAIDASGTHWIAPWDAATCMGMKFGENYAAARDAYLAELKDAQ